MNFKNIAGSLKQPSVFGVAKGLGWFSIALGATQVLSPTTFTRSLGMWGRSTLMRAYGAREIATGLGILANKNPRRWVWGRVGGDALDIATLLEHHTATNPKKRNVTVALGVVLGTTALDWITARKLSRKHAKSQAPDYSDRIGMPRPPEAMRGVAMDFEVPRDMRTPEALQSRATSVI